MSGGCYEAKFSHVQIRMRVCWKVKIVKNCSLNQSIWEIIICATYSKIYLLNRLEGWTWGFFSRFSERRIPVSRTSPFKIQVGGWNLVCRFSKDLYHLVFLYSINETMNHTFRPINQNIAMLFSIVQSSFFSLIISLLIIV